jgi:hypothetical protein
MLTSLIYSRLSAALSSSVSTITAEAASNAPTNSPSDTSADAESFTAPLLSGYARYTSAHVLNRKAVLTQLASEDIFTALKSAFLNDFCK